MFKKPVLWKGIFIRLALSLKTASSTNLKGNEQCFSSSVDVVKWNKKLLQQPVLLFLVIVQNHKFSAHNL